MEQHKKTICDEKLDLTGFFKPFSNMHFEIQLEKCENIESGRTQVRAKGTRSIGKSTPSCFTTVKMFLIKTMVSM